MVTPLNTPSDLDLLTLHIEALFTHNAGGQIERINEPNGDPAPRFYLGRTRTGNLWRLRHDISPRVAAEVERLAAAEPVSRDLAAEPRRVEDVRRVLDGDAGRSFPQSGAAYRFPPAIHVPDGPRRITVDNVKLVERMAPDWERFGRHLDEREPCFAVVEDGRAVCVCFSSRLTDAAAEAGVETLPAYRGRGFAPAVVAAWALAVRDSGRIPLYSTDRHNTASQAVARKLDLIQYAVDLSL